MDRHPIWNKWTNIKSKTSNSLEKCSVNIVKTGSKACPTNFKFIKQNL